MSSHSTPFLDHGNLFKNRHVVLHQPTADLSNTFARTTKKDTLLKDRNLYTTLASTLGFMGGKVNLKVNPHQSKQILGMVRQRKTGLGTKGERFSKGERDGWRKEGRKVEREREGKKEKG